MPLYLVKSTDRKYDEAEYQADHPKGDRSDRR
jgi:hypothetical protein